MAGRIKGITVEINGDTTKLSKALQNVDKSIKNTQTQLKDVEKLLKLDPTNTELLAQKQKLLGQAVSDTKTRLDTLKKASEEAAKTKDNYDAWKAKYDPIKQKISETEIKLRDLKEQSKTADEQLAKGEISKEKYDALQREIKEVTSIIADDILDYRDDDRRCGYCKCILGKCGVTEMQAQIAELVNVIQDNNNRIDELTSIVEEMTEKKAGKINEDATDILDALDDENEKK